MADKQGSARVTLREIDLSQVRDPEQLPQGVPAAVVGPAKRGPAFVPRTFADMQQFGEVFGSMLEISKESNSNRFGPLALNEWMRSAQAGTFLRVLGVGDADGRITNSTNKVAGAGFVVGNKVSHDTSNKLQKNPSAVIDNGNVVGATKAGRTHLLGCFMKDVSGSTFLQDSGIQSDSASGQLDITFTAVPNADDFLLLTGVSATASRGFKVTFAAGNNNTIAAAGQGSAHDVNITVGITGLTHQNQIVSALVNALKGLNRANGSLGVAAENDPATYFTTSKPAANRIVITQIGTGAASNTLGSFNITAGVSVVGDETKTESESSQTVTSTSSAVARTPSSSTITVTGNPADNDTFRITDALGKVSTIVLDISDDDAAVDAAGTVTVGIASAVAGNSNNDIAAAIESAIQASIAADNHDQHDGTPVITVSRNGAVVTVTSTLNSNALLLDNETDANNKLDLVNVRGSNGSKSTITLDINGLPAVGDEFTLNTVNESTNAVTDLAFKFVAESATEPGSLNGTVDSGKVRIELNQNIDILLTRIQSAIEASSVDDKYTVIVDALADTVLIRRTQEQGFVQDRDFVFKLGENISVIGSTEEQGNFGPKSISFAGGGGSASPIIRGLLMSPQGVVPALDQSSAFYATAAAGASANKISKDVANGSNLLNFGSTPADMLIGYEIGGVSSVDQSFKLVLNGFDSSTEPKVLTCSFDPESVNYFAKVLNTDPEKIEDRGHYLHMHWDIDKSKAIPSINGIILQNGNVATFNEAAFCMPTSLDRATPSSTIPDLESYDTRFRTAASPWFVSQNFGGTTYDLFKLYALDDGEAGNDRFRILISNIRTGINQSDYGSFDLSLEAFDSDPVNGETLIAWKRLSLDPDSKNFIGRVIGDRHVYYDFDREANKQRLIEEGEYEVRNNYVRVELHNNVSSGLIPSNTLVAGFGNYTTLNTTAASVLVESGDDGNGNNRLLSTTTLDGVAALPLPLVKSILLSNSADFSLPWGVKFSKYEKTSEISDIRFNPSMKSWTMFMPDLGGSNASAGITNSSKQESFSLERIAVDDASNINWDTSTYIRSGADSDLNGKHFIVLNDAAAVGRNVRYLKFRCLMQGGFDGLNIFNKDKAALNTFAAHREANDETSSSIFTGPTIVAYKKAVDVLADKSATEFQLLSIPGIREPLVVDHAITACETRFDAMLVLDIEESSDASINSVINDLTTNINVTNSKDRFAARGLDTSFAAAYFPDVLIRRPSTGTALQVPPSVAMLGVMSQNDRIADPWFAPAGLNRGRISNATKSKVQMNRDILDDLYDADINPIYEPAGRAGQVYAFGQKTLLQDASALDRINVRRLLISIRRQVKAIAQTFLFEPNRESTLVKFSSLVEPLMADIQARQGVERYKVQIDTSTTTDNDVLNNTIRGKIYLQPTKSVEFISLDFVVTNSID